MKAILPAPALCAAPPKATQSARPAPRLNRNQRRKQRNRVIRNRLLLIGATSLIAGFIFAPHAAEPKVIASDYPESKAVVEVQQFDNLVAIKPYTPHLLSSIDMDYDTQLRIFTMACDSNPELYAAVMAIATTESGINPDAVGDEGTSFGMMQISTIWQQERIEDLGITDLTNPVQNAMVAVDYINWITDHIKPSADGYGSNDLFMVYNMGLNGYHKAIAAGKTSTAYSNATMETYKAYIQEIYSGAAQEVDG